MDVPETLVAPHRVIWHPAHESNYGGYGGAENVPMALVLHTPEEPADDWESTPNWFANPQANASTHYYADNDGDLYQMVRDVDAAWAQNVKASQRHWKGTPGFHPPWTMHGNNNTRALSIEIEGYAGSFEFTDSQFDTVATWLAYKADQYNIPLTRRHVVGHEELATHKSDPGIALGTFPIDDLIFAARNIAAGDPNARVKDLLREALALLGGD